MKKRFFLVVMSFVLLLAQGVWAQEASNVELVGRWPYGPAHAVAVDPERNLAFLGSGGGIYVLDVSTPASPRKFSEITTPEMVEDLFYNANRLFVADGYGGLRIIDVSTPSAPTEVGFLDTPGVASGVTVYGSLAYLADENGLRIIDVSNLSAPKQVGFFDTPDSALDITVSGSLAYVADAYSGLRVIDVSTPSAPTEVGSFDTPDHAKGVTVSGSLAYVVDGYGGLRIIDVSTPSAPTEVGFFDTPGYAKGITVSGSLAYVADDESGLRIIDVSTPSAPTEVGFFDTPGWAKGVTVSGSLAYVADGKGGLRVIDVSTPSAPTEVGFSDTPGYAYNITVSGFLVYVADSWSGLRIIDVNTPSDPSEIGFFNTPGSALDITVSGSLAYVADDESGLRIIDVSTPSAPTEVGFFDTPGYAKGVTVSGSLAYVADDESGLRIIDVSTPSAPTEVGSFDTPDHAQGITVSGSLAYVADGSGGLRIIDVSNPSAPTEVGFFDTPGSAKGVTVSGSLAYVADDENGLRIIDVSTPSAPTEVGSFDTPDHAQSITVSGSLAYVADGKGGLRVIDVSTPSAPTEVGFFSTPDFAYGVAVSGSLAYVADGWSGLAILRFTGEPGGSSFQFDAATYSVGEEDNSVTVTVTRTGSTEGTATVDYVTANGTATAGADYTNVSGTLTFAGGETDKTFSVPILNDTEDENDETIILTLSNPTGGATLGTPATAVLTITDDDSPVVPPQLTAGVTADPPSGPAPLATRFTATVEGGTPPYTYQWDFGDGGTSTEANPSHTYTGAGSYNVTLTVSDAGEQTVQAKMTVSVLEPVSELLPPTNLRAEQVGNSIRVSWDFSVSANVSGYNVYVARAKDGPWSEVNPEPVSGSTFEDSLRLESGKTYYYYVTTVDRSGNESVPSDVVSVDFVHFAFDARAIILAGGGSGDPLWNSIRTCADRAYKTLTDRGFHPNSILYLSPEVGNPDVDKAATSDNLREAILGATDARHVVLYLVDHGDNGTFRVGDTEILSAPELSQWLNDLQQNLPIALTMVYEACRSGSFFPHLVPPAGRQRVVITSASADEPATIDKDGFLSFSQFFWSGVGLGSSVLEAFNMAKDAMRPYQTALLDTNGNGRYSDDPDKEDQTTAGNLYIGEGGGTLADAPRIGSAVVSPDILSGQTEATIWANNVTTTGQIQEVWAVILEPDRKPDSSAPVSNLPTVKLQAQGGNHYSGVRNGFFAGGVHKILVYAMDTAGNVSQPVQTLLYQSNNGPVPVVANSDAPDAEFSFAPGQPMRILCKAEKNQKIWVFLQVPKLYPGVEFIRPGDAYCRQQNRYVFPFASGSEDLYFAESFADSKIDFGFNDLTGIGELIITIRKGSSPENLETIQTMRLVEN